MKDLEEDVAANAVDGGHVAGLGVGPQGEPPAMLRRKKFAGNEVFTINSESFNRCRCKNNSGDAEAISISGSLK